VAHGCRVFNDVESASEIMHGAPVKPLPIQTVTIRILKKKEGMALKEKRKEFCDLEVGALSVVQCCRRKKCKLHLFRSERNLLCDLQKKSPSLWCKETVG
jgi:hypothetical protein